MGSTPAPGTMLTKVVSEQQQHREVKPCAMNTHTG
nr:MAG TPA: hypothetical protein [Caudoviricetes sp.]